jgi:hypothetical protein
VDAVDAGGRGLVGNGDRNSSTRDSGWFLADEHRTGTCGRVFLVKSGFFCRTRRQSAQPSVRADHIIGETCAWSAPRGGRAALQATFFLVLGQSVYRVSYVGVLWVCGCLF